MSVQDLIRGRHQCLTEEVHYSFQNGPDALRAGDTPGSSDCFSQRNLVILGSDNPGGGASHVVQHTFEVRGARLRSGGRAGSDERPRGRIRLPNDELLLWWNDVPDGTLATIAFGGIGADDILALERRRPEASRLTRVDPDTIACVVGGLTHIPLPPTERDVPALVTLTLPDDVRYGQQFSVLVQQVGMPERAILGTFEVSVRVEQPVSFLGDEQDTLAVMRHVQGRTGAEDRWSPIVARYVSQLAEKVNALGGDATAIPPSPRGAPTRRAKGCAALLWAMLRRASRL